MKTMARSEAETCFFERDPNVPLMRRAMVEAVGTLLFVFATVGSALTPQHLLPQSPVVGLFVGAVATGGALIGLILAFGCVSGAHFNPLISGLQWLAGERSLGCTLAYVTAQLLGGIVGALLANLIFGVVRQPIMPSAQWRLAASEIVATVGLMIVVFGCTRSGRAETGPFAVGVWLAAAIIATPSTSYANPAIVVSALFAAGPVALSATTALLYVPAEVSGALIAFVIVGFAYPLQRL
jgi:glycerol uptake facilitator-like aquaporin